MSDNKIDLKEAVLCVDVANDEANRNARVYTLSNIDIDYNCTTTTNAHVSTPIWYDYKTTSDVFTDRCTVSETFKKHVFDYYDEDEKKNPYAVELL